VGRYVTIQSFFLSKPHDALGESSGTPVDNDWSNVIISECVSIHSGPTLRFTLSPLGVTVFAYCYEYHRDEVVGWNGKNSEPRRLRNERLQRELRVTPLIFAK
jgi:hypothetical protein